MNRTSNNTFSLETSWLVKTKLKAYERYLGAKGMSAVTTKEC